MTNLTQDQSQKLRDILEAINSTRYGKNWPKEYSNLFRNWGFFNSIYNALYSDDKEWKKIARFSLDTRFSDIWGKLSRLPETNELAHQPCVGNGRDNYKPELHTRIAFQTLRTHFNVDLNVVCQSTKCQSRQQKSISLCLEQRWADPPRPIATPKDAKFAPLGATLLIIYQIRNNLFHGSKQEITGPDYERNIILVRTSARIMRVLLKEISNVFAEGPTKA